MRYAADHKEQTRQQLVSAAAQALRRDGPDRIGVASIMAQVGLTHGGFYAHFKSKEELIAAAIDAMFEERSQAFAERIEGLAPVEALSHYIDSYLSRRHCEGVENGCPLPALAADVSRLGPAARKRFAAGIERLRRNVATLFARLGDDDAKAMQLATSLLAEMAGTLAIARTIGSAAKAREICEQAGKAIKERLGLPAS